MNKNITFKALKEEHFLTFSTVRLNYHKQFNFSSLFKNMQEALQKLNIILS